MYLNLWIVNVLTVAKSISIYCLFVIEISLFRQHCLFPGDKLWLWIVVWMRLKLTDQILVQRHYLAATIKETSLFLAYTPSEAALKRQPCRSSHTHLHMPLHLSSLQTSHLVTICCQSARFSIFAVPWRIPLSALNWISTFGCSAEFSGRIGYTTLQKVPPAPA